MRRHLRVRSLLAALASAAVLASGVGLGAAQGAVAAAGPVYGGTLDLSTQNPPQTLDVGKSGDILTYQFMYLLYNTLVSYAPTSSRIVPSLATSWSHNAKGTVWTFNLRKGVTFSNGDPFTSQDVVFTYTRLNEGVTSAPSQSDFAVIQGANALFNATAKSAPASAHVAGVVAEGPYRVRITLTTPEAFFLNVLALTSAGIEDAKVAGRYNALERAGKPIDPVGTGPFILQPVGASPSQYVFVRNPHYWNRGLPYLNKIVIHVGASPSLQLAQFERGQIQAMPPFIEYFGVQPAQYLEIVKNPTLRKEYYIQPDIGFNNLGFDVQAKPWNNVKVRQAVEYALNKKLIWEVLSNGRGKIANSILPPGMPGYEPTYNPYPVDYSSPASIARAQAKARQLLKEAGYPNGLNAGTFYLPAGLGDAQLAPLVVTELAQVGIHVQAKVVTLGAFINLLLAKPSQLTFYRSGWTQDYPDPQDFMFNMFDGAEAGNNNLDFVNDPTVNRLLAAADTSLNQAQRLKLYDRVQHIAMQQAWVVPLTFAYQDGLIGPNAYPKNPVIWAHPVLPAQLDRVWVTK